VVVVIPMMAIIITVISIAIKGKWGVAIPVITIVWIIEKWIVIVRISPAPSESYRKIKATSEIRIWITIIPVWMPVIKIGGPES